MIMGLNNILCELYLLKELEDKNKNLYKFKYKYSNNLTDQEKQLYILERQKVYNNVIIWVICFARQIICVLLAFI